MTEIPQPPQPKQDITPYLIQELFNATNLLYFNNSRGLSNQEIASQVETIANKCGQIKSSLLPNKEG